METIQLFIGSSRILLGGHAVDSLRPVEFVGEEIGRWSMTRRPFSNDYDIECVKQVLYKTEDDRLIVFVKDWSRWQGEADVMSLHEVTAADLGVNGQYEELGYKCGFGRPLTLDEALSEN